METLSKKAFCTKCDQMVSYVLRTGEETKTINGKKYLFVLPDAYCEKCGNIVTPHGLIDMRVQEITKQYYQKTK